MVEYTLGKKERLNSKTLIERLFLGGSKSFPAFPLRVEIGRASCRERV